MAGPTKPPSSEESWRLIVDDLFAPLPDARIRVGGPGPFVINLCTSPVPISLPDKDFLGGCHAAIFQSQRAEDGRPRHRLRMGPYAEEADADAELLKVRARYPGAMTARADEQDLRLIANLRIAAKAPRVKAPPVKAPPVEAPPVEAPPVKAPAIATVAPPRDLFTLELEEDAPSAWFAIQLAQAPEAFVLEAVPPHEIFSAYRLYSVACMEARSIVHALRLGFFADESSALAVTGHLAAAYEKTTILRVSVAEHRRFAEQPPVLRAAVTKAPTVAKALPPPVRKAQPKK
jgi:hypothetical protein